MTNSIVIEVIFISLVACAFFTDVRSFRIPNGIPLALLVLFVVYFLLLPLKTNVTSHVVAGAIAFGVTFAFYLKGWMGAGDVKLIGVLTLWAGPQNAFQFLAIMSFIGGAVAASLLMIGRRLSIDPGFGKFIPSRLRAWALRGVFPYGVAISAAAVISAPSFFR